MPAAESRYGVISGRMPGKTQAFFEGLGFCLGLDVRVQLHETRTVTKTRPIYAEFDFESVMFWESFEVEEPVEVVGVMTAWDQKTRSIAVVVATPSGPDVRVITVQEIAMVAVVGKKSPDRNPEKTG